MSRYSRNGGSIGPDRSEDTLNDDKGVFHIQDAFYLKGASRWGASPQGQIVFTSTGGATWTVPSGVLTVSAVVVGGGGGASACPGTSAYSGNGGGGGGLSYGTFSVTPGETLSLTIGAAGSGGSSGTNAGTSGGYSRIVRGTTVLLQANGGSGGTYGGGTKAGGSSSGSERAGGGTGGSGEQLKATMEVAAAAVPVVMVAMVVMQELAIMEPVPLDLAEEAVAVAVSLLVEHKEMVVVE